ncbi:protein bicaudal C homolog 1-like [Dendronephthya gigantea]|uniref:protein bicaudal C homolog 1-like n=1 Tax=Dendronephthya gigantea TaxID=151771 RepID=UPI00106A473C|nr:protein bicaudal C homolog 1-like [Dendronephthya gigantea]
MEHNLTAVVEETEHEITVAGTQTPNEQDNHGHGEKFRVDRRKLEQMLRECGEDGRNSADDFFNQIMGETDTVISWPTKLKIGAKSKKDPHIKIAGLPENVKKAKDMVGAKLESKANRVTLKMDVSHTDHSHIIGRRGQSINKVMDETNCHIHFPDSNRGSISVEKSNQVSITGQPEGVEKARLRIREMLPLVLCFEIPDYDNMFLPLDPMIPSIQNIAQQYDVTFTPKGRTQVGCLVVAVRGSQDRVAYMQEAMACLSKQLTGSSEIPNVVQLHLDVAPQHHIFLVGRSACNIRDIMEQTGAKIELPDTTRSNARNGMITVTGPIHSVIQARSSLVNCLPLLLMFDLKEEESKFLQDQPDKVKQIETKFCVSITIKPKPKQSSKSVTIKSKEENAQNMYLTRLEILGNPMNPHIMQHPPPISLPFAHHGTPWYANIQTSPYVSPLASPTPHSIRSNSPVPFTRRLSPPNGQSRPPPGFDIWRHHHRSESFNNGDYHRRSNSADTELSKIVRTAASEGGSPTQSFDFTHARRNSEPTPYADVWNTSPNSSQSKAPGTRTSPPSLVASAPKQRYAILDGIKNAGSHRLLDSHGSNPSSSFDSVASTSLNLDRMMDSAPQNKFVDYEKKKDLSTEVMKGKIAHNQIRVPTDMWSGLHLSKSTDFQAIKKSEVEKEAMERKSPTHENSAKPELERAVRRNPSASMQVSRERKNIESPFSSKASASVVTSSGLEEVLSVYRLEDLADRFKRLEINSLDVFISLTKDDLKEAGFEPLGLRKRIENAIEDMKKVKQNAIRDSVNYRAQNYRVGNPLQFGARSGRF